MSAGFLYEDFAVGQTFRSPSLRMERDRIVSFSGEFDPQPQHMSEQAAADSQFGALVASGWHTAAVSMRLYIAALPPIAKGGQGLAVEDLAWPNPVRPGDDLRVETEVTWKRESRSRPDRGLIKIRAVTLNQRSEIVQTVTHMMIITRRQAGPAEPLQTDRRRDGGNQPA